jgi:hypothetical protein
MPHPEDDGAAWEVYQAWVDAGRPPRQQAAPQPVVPQPVADDDCPF